MIEGDPHDERYDIGERAPAAARGVNVLRPLEMRLGFLPIEVALLRHPATVTISVFPMERQ